jgi:hypothetical protein
MAAAGSPQTKYMAGAMRHDCKDALSRIELLLIEAPRRRVVKCREYCC